jgi:hypothetical protein
MLIIVGENKKRALLRYVFTGWYYESARQNHTYGIVNKNGANP